MRRVTGEPTQILDHLIDLLNEYKFYVDTTVIFDSRDDFLYRQKGQLKLDNGIIEEFLPWLIRPVVLPELAGDAEVGPAHCYSALYFQSSLESPGMGGNPLIP